MNATHRSTTRLLIVIVAGIIPTLFSCSSERTKPTLPGTHPAAWNDPSSADFHGKFVTTHDAEFCKDCHGADLRGGKTEIGCIDCHLSSGACASCHGGTHDISGAPPVGLSGETDDTTLAVGAHQTHVTGSGTSARVECGACHVVPVLLGQEGHLDGDDIAEVIWGGFADGGMAVWNRDSATCENTYCHGRFSGGDTTNVPVWNAGDQALCGSCHDVGGNAATLKGIHPFHVNDVGLSCAACHANVVDTGLTIVTAELHVNGVADTARLDNSLCDACHGAGGESCISCHGGQDNSTGAPPLGLRGEQARSERAVGAHTTHLTDGPMSEGFPCNTCHKVPTSIDAADHLGTDSVVELTWSALAGDQATWDRSTETCTGTYCHGNFSGGYADFQPVWTDSTAVVCGECHAVAHNVGNLGWKHSFHVQTAGLDCSACHASVVGDGFNLVSLDLHINGQVDTLVADTTLCTACHGDNWGSCTSCHGGIDNQTGAPPDGLEDETATTDLAVGAHTSHVEGGAIGAGMDCDNCHIVPISMDDSLHLGEGIAEITWGGIAGDSAVWNRGLATCSTTYCHGFFAGGDSSNAAIWTGADQAACGSCHDAGSDPASLAWSKHDLHVLSYSLGCVECHATVVDDTLGIVDTYLHVNGGVETFVRDNNLCGTCHDPAPDGCIGCHGGGDNLTGAPPIGLRGESATSEIAVGAHTAHLEGGPYSDGIDCADCHVVPTILSDAGHLGPDSVAELTWSLFAGAASSWDSLSRTCSDTYCHGDFRGGNPANTPDWTGTDQAACGSCHDDGADPTTLRDSHFDHVNDGIGCYQCHAATVDAANQIIGPSVHINGLFDVVFSSGQGTYSGGQCSGLGSGCHGLEDW